MAVAEQLAKKHCVPCSEGAQPLSVEKANGLLTTLPHWKLTAEGNRLRREWRVLDFMTAMDFFHDIAQIAEAEDHHPDLHLENYRNVAVELWTHAAGGLTENDFIMAAKIDEIPVELKK
jgi:4a-hydroxytetrahydrobiopterin dehydratase